VLFFLQLKNKFDLIWFELQTLLYKSNSGVKNWRPSRIIRIWNYSGGDISYWPSRSRMFVFIFALIYFNCFVLVGYVHCERIHFYSCKLFSGQSVLKYTLTRVLSTLFLILLLISLVRLWNSLQLLELDFTRLKQRNNEKWRCLNNS